MPAVAAVQPAREGTSLMIVASSPGTAPRPRNSEILGADLTDYPPALNDLYSERPLGKWLDKVFALADSIPGLPPAWHNSLDLRSIDHSMQFHPGLPDPHPPGDPYHDVYVVSVPHRKWPTSLKHWSLYTQGCFFHLIRKSAPELKMELVDVNTLDAKLAQLRDEIQGGHFHNSAMMDRQAVDGLRPSRTNLPLTAYHVGQTVFNLEQLEKIARYTMSRIDTYSLFEKNCHAFTLSMMRRTVMTKRDGTIFTGTKVQIVNWDMRLKGAGTNAYDQYLGFLISGPRPGTSSFLPKKTKRDEMLTMPWIQVSCTSPACIFWTFLQC
ncbi:hypothetical protein EDD37DRAFT_70580 [Exophiala viscosa]|uniref:uncharacterized protein n=1 Tax=Exophiala viscosa TaxID=2486360 RepID=UPI00219CB460|nr:hypothetical protein EDD37DRAFT_70580 [Exophiala viscosa]